MDRKQLFKGYIFIVLSALIFGLMPLMAKMIYADGVNPMTLVFLRNLFALPSLAILALSTQKTLKVPLRTLPKLSFISFFGCTLTPVLLFSSYNYIASGTATVLHFIYPALVALGGILFFRKKVEPWTVVSIALCVLGVALFYNPGEPLDLTGSLFAICSGVTFAVYVIALSRFKDSRVSGFLFSFYVAAASSIMTFILCIATGNLALPTTLGGWLLCALFATAVTTGAVVLFQQGAFIIGGEKTSILSTLEPITGVAVGLLILHESASINALFGCALVIAASVMIAICDFKKNNKNSKDLDKK